VDGSFQPKLTGSNRPQRKKTAVRWTGAKTFANGTDCLAKRFSQNSS